VDDAKGHGETLKSGSLSAAGRRNLAKKKQSNISERPEPWHSETETHDLMEVWAAEGIPGSYRPLGVFSCKADKAMVTLLGPLTEGSVFRMLITVDTKSALRSTIILQTHLDSEAVG
jgi:hypothetical protein